MGVSSQPLSPPPSSSPRRSLASFFSIRCCGSLCGRNSLCGYEFDELFGRFPAGRDGFSSPQNVQEHRALWHDSWRLLGSRRKGSNAVSAFPEEVVLSDDLYCKPPRWKIFFRKLRAETRRFNCNKPAPPGFHYDPLSYAMNFDDGCWQ